MVLLCQSAPAPPQHFSKQNTHFFSPHPLLKVGDEEKIDSLQLEVGLCCLASTPPPAYTCTVSLFILCAVHLPLDNTAGISKTLF